jgi:TetR/AcrR family transcriptional regulator, transcriptional repressor for nem operon
MAAEAPKVTGNKAKLINAAVGLLAEKGFRGTLTDDILTSSGVSRSNFYYHFESKEALCLAALDRIGYMFLVTVINQTLANMAYEPAQRLESYFDYLIQVVETESCDIGCVFTNLATEGIGLEPAFHDKILEIDGKVSRAIEHTVREGIDTGAFRFSGAPSDLAWLVLSLLKGAMLLSTIRKDPDILCRCKETIFTLLGQPL